VHVAVGTDERAPVVAHLVAWLSSEGHQVDLVADGTDWPEAGRAVGRAVAEGRAERGIVLCTTGTGVSMAANKVPGIRAALCSDAATAAGARRWNDANVLALGIRLTSPALAEEIAGTFLATAFDPDESALVARLEDPAGT
jgi:ribose 5-phosphate isomerase B